MPTHSPEPTHPGQGPTLQIIGVGVCTPTWRNLAACDLAVYTGQPFNHSLLSDDPGDAQQAVLRAWEDARARWKALSGPVGVVSLGPDGQRLSPSSPQDWESLQPSLVSQAATLHHGLRQALIFMDENAGSTAILESGGLALAITLQNATASNTPGGYASLSLLNPETTDQESQEEYQPLVELLDGGSFPLEISQTVASPHLPAIPEMSCAYLYSEPPGSHTPGGDLFRLLRAVISLYHRYIPACPEPEAMTGAFTLEQDSPLYIPSISLPWLVPGMQPRAAEVLVKGSGLDPAPLLLIGGTTSATRADGVLASQPLRLFLLEGDDPTGLVSSLDTLEQALQNPVDLNRLSLDNFLQRGEPKTYTLALLGSTSQELVNEIGFARKGLPRAFERQTEWQTPAGSYFSPTPLGPEAQTALVYPGAFNSFINLGKDLFHLFPGIFPRLANLTQDVGRVLGERALYPRAQTALSRSEMESQESSLHQDPVTMLTSGTTLATIYTHILQAVFGIQPSAAFGYSLGETSMMYASSVWQDGDEGYRRLSTSPLFHTRLSGPKEAVREYWGMSGTDETLAWANMILMCSPAAAIDAIQSCDRVYLTHINTPNQVVIGGDPAQCEQVARRLGCPALTAPFDHVLHCEPVVSEFDDLAALHTFPVDDIPSLTLYTASHYGPVELNSRWVAQSIARALCTSLDFPRLVNRVYESGVRVFIETGAGSNCTRWIDESLKAQPHIAVPVSRKGSDDFSPLVRLLARLASHHIRCDLSPLYQA